MNIIYNRKKRHEFLSVYDGAAAVRETDSRPVRRIRQRRGEPMSIASDMIRGHTDTIILAHLLRHDSYGYEINKAIQQTTGGRYELKEATLYTAFRRLEQAGFIPSYWGDETTGARRRYYSISHLGRAAYRQYRADWEEVRQMIDRLIDG